MLEPGGRVVRRVGMEAEPKVEILNTGDHPDADRLRSLADLEALYRTERVRLVRLAHLLTGSNSVAEEIVQDAFVAIYQKRDTIEDPPAYLHRTVVNRCHSKTRRRTSERSKLQLIAARSGSNAAPAPSEPEEIWRHLDALTQRQRAAIVLRFYLDLSVDDAADAMGVRTGTIKSLVHRGLHILREELHRDD